MNTYRTEKMKSGALYEQADLMYELLWGVDKTGRNLQNGDRFHQMKWFY